MELLTIALAQGNVVPRDGTWEGTTSDGETFTLEVSDNGTRVQVTGFRQTYRCKRGDDPTVGHGFNGIWTGIDANTAEFTWMDGLRTRTHAEAPHRGSAHLVDGTFTDARNAEGTITSWAAAFKGRKFRTQTCDTRRLTWTARRVSARISPEAAFPERTAICLSCAPGR